MLRVRDTQHPHPGMMGFQHERHIIPFPTAGSRLSPAGLGPDRLAPWTSRIGSPRDLICRGGSRDPPRWIHTSSFKQAPRPTQTPWSVKWCRKTLLLQGWPCNVSSQNGLRPVTRPSRRRTCETMSSAAGPWATADNTQPRTVLTRSRQ